MEEGLHFITTYLEEFTYSGIFLVLLLAGFGLPFPEEIILVFSGYLAFLKYTKFPYTLIVVFVGVLMGDLILFSIGRRWGGLVLNHHRFHLIFTEKRLDKARRFFNRYGKRTIFFARFLSGVRAPVYLVAGTIGMKGLSFFLMDLFAALLTVPLLTFCGFYFGENIDSVISVVRRTEFFTFFFIFIGGMFLLLLYLRHQKRRGS